MLEDSQILEALESWNKAAREVSLKERAVVDNILSLLKKEVIDVIGVRRSGKSSVLFLIIKRLGLDENNSLYVNFEEPRFTNYLGTDLLEKIWDIYRIKHNPPSKPYLFLDEVQLVQGWEKWVRKIRDLQLAHVFVTGSSSKLMSRELGTALTGRHISIMIYPLSFREFLEFNQQNVPKTDVEFARNKLKILKHFSDYFSMGGFPEIVLTRNEDLLKNYFEDILYKDIVIRHEIRDVASLRKLALFCLTNLSKPITYNSLRKQFSLSLDTIRDYLSYFEESFLIFQLRIFSYSLKVQEISPKKIYCIDNGLRNAVSFKISKDKGRLAENLVFIELRRRGKEIYYWKKKHEVDFVIRNKDQSLTAMNVCYSNKIEERELEGLLEFKKEFKSKVKEMVLLTKDFEKKGKIIYIPLWKWLLKEMI